MPGRKETGTLAATRSRGPGVFAQRHFLLDDLAGEHDRGRVICRRVDVEGEGPVGDEGLGAKMRENALRYVEDNYRWDVIMRGFDEIIEYI